MLNFIKNLFKKKEEEIIEEPKQFGTGAFPDPEDENDYEYEPVLGGVSKPVDWEKGYDIEKELDIIIPIKDQNGSSSCVGMGWSYYVGILDAVENGHYSETSAKAIYSQIFLKNGGAYLRDAAKLIVNWGSLREDFIPSYYVTGEAPNEAFMRELNWKNDKVDKIAEILKAKEYRKIRKANYSMDTFAQAIRDNYGVVGGVSGSQDGKWSSMEPKPPVNGIDWGHCIYFGKFGIDEKGKYISTPNSWGNRDSGSLYPDGWQKLREDYFKKEYMFNPWTLTDKPNSDLSKKLKVIIMNNEKKIIIEGEVPGRKGIIIDGYLREIKDDTNNRSAAACLYVLANNGFGQFVSKEDFDKIVKKQDF